MLHKTHANMYSIDAELLIDAIKTRPALYNKDNKLYYTQKCNKHRIWRDVCVEINPDWGSFDQLQKTEYVFEVQKRWKSLRTCFTRELAFQRKERMKRDNDQQVKKRKRYEYFDSMLFLLESSGNGEAGDGVEGGEDRDSDDSADPLHQNTSYPPEEFVYDYGESSSEVKPMKIEAENTTEHYVQVPPLAQQVYEKSNSLEGKILDMLKDCKKDENDEDRQFMLSLVPTFRQLNATNKLVARIEILKVLQNLTTKEN